MKVSQALWSLGFQFMITRGQKISSFAGLNLKSHQLLSLFGFCFVFM